MPVPRRRVTPRQFLVVGIKKYQPRFETPNKIEAEDYGIEKLCIEIARADIDADGKRSRQLLGFALQRLKQARQEVERQMIDGFVAQVLEGFERRRLACAGQAGNKQYALPRARACSDDCRMCGFPVARFVAVHSTSIIAPVASRTIRRTLATADASKGAI